MNGWRQDWSRRLIDAGQSDGLSSSTNAAIRAAAARSAREFSRAVIDAGYRQDVYARVKAIGGEG